MGCFCFFGGGGGGGSVGKFDGNIFSVSDMGRKNYSETLQAFKKYRFVEKINVAKKNSDALWREKQYFYSERNHINTLQVKWMFP